MWFESFYRTQRALKQYLEKVMEPADLVAILRTSQSSSFLDQFTSDPARVRASIDQMHWHAPLALQTIYWPVIPTLRSVVKGLERMPGRKSVIVFSYGLEIRLNTTNTFREIAGSAARASVRIYGIDPGGLE